ncbi:MAG TPA: YkgJ family cysteine cluster protein [Nitrospirae bacterium]|nr:YkgJ family cysteine cluster protein [Nitrospirota bacterium]
MKINMKDVDIVSHSLNSKFKFKCYKGISCFTKCCSNIDILLTPYDIVRLKNRLNMLSGQFLLQYTYIDIDEKTSHPFVFLKMKEGGNRECPFVYEEGCNIYTDRPASCRYYPVGQGSLKKMDENLKQPYNEEFYFFVREDHCKGYQEDKEWTIKEWRQDQEAELYDDINRGWKEILFRKNLPGLSLDEKKQKAFYMASYDIDRFSDFVFKSGFLDKFDVDPEKVERMKKDEVELLQFAFSYIKYILMMEQTLKLKE